ncbi:MAG: hypothetical protein DRQ88_09300 [Epsilonproteobacteria bacterium]|nr:MAG: hypothetical protein DRQ88_09300 [Campylobacterota bacterium]
MDPICEKCTVRGRCCQAPVRAEDNYIIYTDVTCPVLDPETKICTDYYNRPGWCKTAGDSDCAPSECGYRKKNGGIYSYKYSEYPEDNERFKMIKSYES